MPSHYFRRLATWRPGRLARNAARGSAFYGVRLGLQAVYFLLLARALGVTAFGVFSGVWVLCGFLATFSGAGFPVLAFRAASLQSHHAPATAGRGLGMIGLTSPILLMVLVFVATTQFPQHPPVAILALLGLSEIAFLPALTLVSSMHQGYERLGRSQAMLASLWLGRVVVVIALAGVGQKSLVALASGHAAITLLVVGGWLLVERSMVQSPLTTALPGRREVMAGLAFAISAGTVIAFTELNQALALAFAGASVAGLVSAAYKVSMIAATPLSVVCQAMSPRLMRSAHDRTTFVDFVRAVAAPLGILAVLCAVAVLLGSFLVPLVFGPAYTAAAPVARSLCVLPLFTGARLLASYVLVAASRQKKRVIAELLCLAVALPTNALLMWTLGLQGAVIGILATEGATALTLTVLAYISVFKDASATIEANP